MTKLAKIEIEAASTARCCSRWWSWALVACGDPRAAQGARQLPTRIGKSEGQLNVVAWEGYTQPQWVKPFEKQTGCQVNSKYAGSSDEMVTLMRQGGGSQYDLVSASGDASLRLIRGGDVAPVNVNLIPDWKNFIPQLQSPPHNTVNGVHYGVSLQWGPNTLLYNTKKVNPTPTSWSTIYGPQYKGEVTVPANPIQIADAALYLSKTKPSLGISDPYELTEKQLNAAGSLLKEQRPLIEKYWALASDEIELFKNGNASSARRGRIMQHVQGRQEPVKDLIPKEGATAGPTRGCSRRTPNTQLRLPMDEMGVRARSPGRAGDLVRRDAGQQARVRAKWKRSKRARAPSITSMPRRLLRLDQVLEDAYAGMREREERLHRLQQVAAEVDRS